MYFIGIKNNWKATLGQFGRFEQMGLCTSETKKSLDYIVTLQVNFSLWNA